MSEENSLSRRESLKRVGVMGTAILFGGAAANAQQATPAPKPAPVEKEKPAVNVVDVALERFAKGHS